jgi:hypothetical protein
MIDGGTPAGQDYHRHHEIYVDQNARTFSHERARMPIQAASGDNLGTDNWHINYVSPKLRGYRDDSTDLNKYVRFKVLSYDSTSGEFEVQLGQRPTPATGTTVNNPGEIVKGRKNVPFRVYDETGNDFIELEYVEVGSSATTINTDKIVDIELFPSLALDDEVLLIATAELNWDPSDNLLVQRVIDRRQVGSVSETEFTQSAKEFITAGDRALHSNGVVRDLEFVQVNPSNDAELVFNGGIALVNGYIVTANNGTVVIPELVETGGSSGSTVDWIVCLNELGNFVTYPLTTTKKHFFAEAGTGGGTAYFLPSVTFSEVVNERKDLVPLLTLTATITSVAISDTKDVRRFVANQTNNIPLVWTQDGYDESSSFRSSNALVNWLTLLSNENSLYTRSKVTVRGDLVLESTLDLSSVPNLVLEADSLGAARISVYADTGLKLGSNSTLRNIKFIHTANSSAPSNIVGISTISPNACILVEPSDGATVENINIENCEFTGQDASYRFPFIYFVFDDNNVRLINIKNNKFFDSTATLSAAIVIAESNNDIYPHSIVDSMFIEDNWCDNAQGIYLIGESSSEIAPMSIRNGHISRNQCGFIGISNSSNKLSAATVNQPSLSVVGNNCNLIYANPDITGTMDTTIALAATSIRGNSCGVIWLYVGNGASEDTTVGQPDIIIDGNILTLRTINTGSGVGGSFSERIAIYSGLSGSPTYHKAITITNNTIRDSNETEVIGAYTYGVFSLCEAIITNNNISGFVGSGIYVSAVGNNVISHNIIRRFSNSISSYINLAAAKGICTENVFDYTTVDGYNDTTIAYTFSNGWVIDKNINHIKVFKPSAAHGQVGWRDDSSSFQNRLGHPTDISVEPVTFYRSSLLTSSSQNVLRMNIDSGTQSIVQWHLPLEGMLPTGAYILDITMNASVNPLIVGTGNFGFKAVSRDGSYATDATDIDLTSATSGSTSLQPNKPVEGFDVVMTANVNCSSQTIASVDFEIKYTFLGYAY